MLVAGKSKQNIVSLKEMLRSEFEMKDLGPARKLLGMEIFRDREKGTLVLSQVEYLKKVIQTYRMNDAKSVNTPIGAYFKLYAVKDENECVDTDETPYSSAVDNVMYAMVGSRPNLAYVIEVVSRYMSKPGAMHWEAMKWLLKYIKGALNLSRTYSKEENLLAQGLCDSDFASDLDGRRSISGYVFTVGGNTVSWKSGLQLVVALSTRHSTCP